MLQRYTIFSKENAVLIAPLLLTILSRAIFILFFQNQYINFDISDNFVFPLLFDGLFFSVFLILPFKSTPRFFLVISLTYLFFSNLIFFHHFRIYLLPPGTGAIAALFETTPLEAIEFTRMTSYKELMGTIAISLIPCLSLLFRKENSASYKQLGISILSLVLLLSAFVPIFSKNLNYAVNCSYLYRDARNIYHYVKEYYSLLTLRENRKGATFHAFQEEELNEEPQTHILIIGESMGRNHMSLYGYEHSTTPNLDTTKDILAFNNVISPTTQTRSSIVRMLTTSNGKDTRSFYQEGSIITAMKDAGFQTYWLSNQSRYGISDTETSAIADDAHESRFVNIDWNAKSLDEKVIPELEEVLSRNEKHQFIIIHFLGSHFEYERRFPSGDRFRINENYNIPYLKEEQIEKVKSYDATIKYTDHLIDSIIDGLRLDTNRRKYSLVYLSDHGEDIYDDERKILGHGSPIVTPYTIEIPFIIWANPEYRKRSLQDFDSSYLNRPFNSADLFHTLCDLYDLNFEAFRKEKSVLSSTFQEKQLVIINSNGDPLPYEDLKR